MIKLIPKVIISILALILINGTAFAAALVYEPFDYPAGELNSATGATEVGFADAWVAKVASAMVTSNSLAHGTLPTTGNKVEAIGASNHFGGGRTIRASALAGNGLLDDGRVLWFSTIMGYAVGANRTNARLILTLSDEPMNSGNYNYWFGTDGATGLGVALGNYGGPGKIVATQIRDLTYGDDLVGVVFGNSDAPAVLVGASTSNESALVVGKITWGESLSDPDLIELFIPGTNLAFPDPYSPHSSLSVTVDQSGYDTITWSRGDLVLLDEIRLGATYNQIIGQTNSGDVTAPTPDPMTFSVSPTALSSYEITMTATEAHDVNGVEYYFACTSSNTADSGWQLTRTFNATNLIPTTEYTFAVKARDLSTSTNETAASGAGSATTLSIDVTPPSPNPMGFANAPIPISNTSITMTASNATDDVYGVEYLFTETSGNPGGSGSGWQVSPTYTDGGLNPETMYTYTVTARDTSPSNNVTAASSGASATTLQTDVTPPSPNPATWSVVPVAVSDTEVTMTATTGTDTNGVEYYFANLTITNNWHDSGWQDSPIYTDTGLLPFSSYTYQVTLRDKSYTQNVGTASVRLPAVTLRPTGLTDPTLLEGLYNILGSQNDGGSEFDVSVFPGRAMYRGLTGEHGPVYGYFGDGNVLDYRFFKVDAGVITNYAQGEAGLVSDVTTPDVALANGNSVDVWVTTDPGDGFTNTLADFAADTAVASITSKVSGTIDISNMHHGSVYFLYGAYRTTPDIDLVMSGSGETDVTLYNIGDDDSANNSENYIAVASFINAAGYTSISYTNNCSNGKFTGVVLCGDLVPAGTCLIIR